MRTLIVTGGAGFIGVNFIRYVLSRPEFGGRVVNADCLTYAGNLQSLADIEERFGGDRYHFERVDVGDPAQVDALFERYDFDGVVHLAAESHVDRSIGGPGDFVRTNILGTFNLLEACRRAWAKGTKGRFHHVSTDEVYGSLGETGRFTEESPYDPRSPYSASKASSDHLVRAYFHTYGLDVTVTNCSNNYGPYQFPEKLIPLMISNMLEGEPLPVYGDGKNVRDWIYVEDHAAALWRVLTEGTSGTTYNVGGDCEIPNIELVKTLCATVARLSGRSRGDLEALITYVKDRPGHDRRYAIDADRIRGELGWRTLVGIDEGLERTVGWYLSNDEWVRSVKTGEYREWIEKNYEDRG